MMQQDTMVYSIIFKVEKWKLNTFISDSLIVQLDCNYGEDL